MKFRKKPVVVEAFQLTRDSRVDRRQWPEWLRNAWDKPKGVVGGLFPKDYMSSSGELRITTLEGEQLVSWGDWIIQGVAGEIYPCNPDIFEATYDVVSEATNE